MPLRLQLHGLVIDFSAVNSYGLVHHRCILRTILGSDLFQYDCFHTFEFRPNPHIMELIANPNSTNPPPKQLTTPDFTAYQRGRGVGKSATNLNVWLTVLEEWKECDIVGPPFENPSIYQP